jgi:hypothetical protein
VIVRLSGGGVLIELQQDRQVERAEDRSACAKVLEAVEKPRLFRKLKGDHVFDQLVQGYT